MRATKPGRSRGIIRLLGLLVLLAIAGAIAYVAMGPAPGPAPAPAGPQPIGAAIAVDPAASVASPPAAPQAAHVDLPVFLDDLVATDAAGAIRIRFADSTLFSLGANARATIDRFAYDPARGASSVLVSFTKGAFRFVSGAPLHADPGQTAIQTPVAAIGIRGTEVMGVIGPEAETLWKLVDKSYVPDGGDLSTATLIVLGAGAIDVSGSGKRITLDQPGQALFFRRKGAAPLGPVRLWRYMLARIDGMASPPGLGPESGGGPPAPTPTPTPGPQPSGEAPPAVVPVRTPGAAPAMAPTPQPAPSPTAVAVPLERVPPWRRPPRPTPAPTPTPTPSPTATPKRGGPSIGDIIHLVTGGGRKGGDGGQQPPARGTPQGKPAPSPTPTPRGNRIG